MFQSRVLLIAQNPVLIQPLREQLAALSVQCFLVEELWQARQAAADLDPALIVFELDLCRPGRPECVAWQLARTDGFPLIGLGTEVALRRFNNPKTLEAFSGFLCGSSKRLKRSIQELFQPAGNPSQVQAVLAGILQQSGLLQQPCDPSSGRQLPQPAHHAATAKRDVSVNDALARSEKLLRTLVDAIPDWIFVKDREHRFVLVNRAFAKAMGHSPEEMLGRTDAELGIPVELAHHFRVDDRAVLSGQKLHELHDRLVSPEGHHFVFVTVKLPLCDSDGGIYGMLGYARDVTTLRRTKKALRDHEALTRGVLEAAPVVLALVQDQAIRWVNGPMMELTGYSEGELLALAPPDLFCDEVEFHRIKQLWERQEAQKPSAETVWLRKDGGRVHVLLNWAPAGPTESAGWVFSAMDITSQVQAKERLRQSATVFESTTEGVVITDPNGLILDVNRAFTEITGFSRQEALGMTPALLRSGRHDTEFYRQMWTAIQDDGCWSGEIWNRKKYGEIYPEWLNIGPVRDESGRITHLVGVFSDLSAIKESQAQLEFLAHHDPLTELPNRLLFSARLEHAIQRFRREGKTFALLCLDLDHFTKVNETIGHALGDELLQWVARRLLSSVRREDTVARLEGDQFVMLLEEVQETNAPGLVARKILDILEQPFQLQSHEVFLTGGIGISLYPQDGETADALLKSADTAVRRAKLRGCNGYAFYTEELTRKAVERLAMETRLRRALERNELELYYQPQVALNSGQLIGLEALMRWNSPDMGLVLPGRFIELAEEIGLIEPMGAWAIRQACRQIRQWQAEGLSVVPVAVNVSAHQFKENDLLEVVQQALEETGLDPQYLELELTESALMRDVEVSARIMERFRTYGIGVAVDDFGTGYSSLAYLHQFPIRKLKIDQSFIQGLSDDNRSAAITNSIIDLARHLGVDVIAEGVQQSAEVDFLLSRGCHLGQGFRYHVPLQAHEIGSLLSH